MTRRFRGIRISWVARPNGPGAAGARGSPELFKANCLQTIQGRLLFASLTRPAGPGHPSVREAAWSS